MTCTGESHERAKADHADTLVFHSLQFDDDGEIALVYFDCTLCGSTLSERGPACARPGESSASAIPPASATNENQMGAADRLEGWSAAKNVARERRRG